MKYINGGWEVVGSTDWLFYYNGVKARLINIATGQSFRRFYYGNLINLYKNGNITINLAAGRYIIECESGNNTGFTTTGGVFNMQLNNDEKNKIVWEILGRIAHLLADVATPAHALNDQHDPITGDDPYENSMGGYSNNFNYNNAINQAQQWGQINISQVTNPIKYLFYTSAQIAGHFPSCDVDGNNLWGKNEPLDITQYSTTGVRGNGLNDIFVSGAFGEILHFNGVRWHSFIDETAFEGAYGEIAVKNNVVVAVGGEGQLAKILIGKRI